MPHAKQVPWPRAHPDRSPQGQGQGQGQAGGGQGRLAQGLPSAPPGSPPSPQCSRASTQTRRGPGPGTHFRFCAGNPSQPGPSAGVRGRCSPSQAAGTLRPLRTRPPTTTAGLPEDRAARVAASCRPGARTLTSRGRPPGRSPVPAATARPPGRRDAGLRRLSITPSFSSSKTCLLKPPLGSLIFAWLYISGDIWTEIARKRL